MTKLSNYKYELTLAGLIVLFVAAKWPARFLPYFWDELGVYSQAALYMLDHGPSMMPGSIDPDLSRGHPLLFVFLMSVVFKLFGSGVVVGHTFTLVLSVLLIITLYAFGRRFFSKRVALAASTVFCLQPIFMAQSVLVLPEVLLSLFGLLSLFFYFSKKIWLYVLFASCAILTKETAVIIPVAVFLAESSGELLNGKGALKNPGKLMKSLLPLVILPAFLIVQKVQNGWFMFPSHVDLISFHPRDIASRFGKGAFFLFYDQGRFWILAAFIMAFIKRRSIRSSPQQRSILKTFILLIALMMIFSALNYHMNRYYLFIFPQLIILFSYLVLDGLSVARIRLMLLAVLFVASTLPFMFVFWKFNTDYDLSYQISLGTLRKGVQFLEQETEHLEEVKVCAQFPAINALKDKRQGYIKVNRFVLTTEMDDAVDYVVEMIPGEWGDLPLSRDLEEIYEDDYYYSQIKIYKVLK